MRSSCDVHAPESVDIEEIDRGKKRGETGEHSECFVGECEKVGYRQLHATCRL